MLLQVAEDIKTIALRHVQIQKQQVYFTFLNMPNSGMTIAGFCYVVTVLP